MAALMQQSAQQKGSNWSGRLGGGAKARLASAANAYASLTTVALLFVDRHGSFSLCDLISTSQEPVSSCCCCRPAGISLMDAGSMAVFSLACLVLYKLANRFSKAVDKATMEVADYTVIVKGLPETTPIDVSQVMLG